MNLKLGFIRLAVLGGTLVEMAWITYCIVIANEQATFIKDNLFSVLALAIISFLVPWSLIRLIGWVIQGFKKI